MQMGLGRGLVLRQAPVLVVSESGIVAITSFCLPFGAHRPWAPSA